MILHFAVSLWQWPAHFLLTRNEEIFESGKRWLFPHFNQMKVTIVNWALSFFAWKSRDYLKLRFQSFESSLPPPPFLTNTSIETTLSLIYILYPQNSFPRYHELPVPLFPVSGQEDVTTCPGYVRSKSEE